MPLLTLTTDFGLADAFVGVMKGVILGICPRVTLVDLTHAISPGNVRAAAFALATAAPYFPKGTVHIAVVDPGVGSGRAALAIRTDRAIFLGPDNGILEPAVRAQRFRECRRISNPRLCLAERSRTFHGRDVFAPVAAHLVRGTPFREVGERWLSRVPLAWPEPVRDRETWRGEVLYVDRFGNAISNLPGAWFGSGEVAGWRIRVGRSRAVPLGECYQAVPTGAAVAVVGSSGYLEIAVRDGSAAARLRLRPGSPVVVRRGGPRTSLAQAGHPS